MMSHAEPSPSIHSNVRRFVAPEMRTKSEPKARASTNESPGAHELGRILRANIENLLAEGGRWNTDEVVAEFKKRKISGSITSIRRHLNNMTDIGVAIRSINDANKTVDYWQSGKNPPSRITQYKGGKPCKPKMEKPKVGSGNAMFAIMEKNRKLILAAVADGCKTNAEIMLKTKLSRSCVQIQSAALAVLGKLLMEKIDRTCIYSPA